MAQPSFVPVADSSRVRPSIPAPIPTKARRNRPGELRSPALPSGSWIGHTGPDQGYALLLAHRLAPRLRLVQGEDAHDVELGIALLGSRRAAANGRAPCIYDVQSAADAFGFLEDAPAEVVARRKVLFSGLAHSYDVQRVLVDAVPASTLPTPARLMDAGVGPAVTIPPKETT